MLQGRAVQSLPAKPSSMGRKRTIHHSLPPRMQMKGQSYYYVSNGKPRTWTPLGTDIAKAKRKWAELEAGGPVGLSVGDLVQRYIDRKPRPESTAMQYKSYHKALAAAFPVSASALTSQHVALWRDLPAQSARQTFTNGCMGLLMSAYRLGHEQGLCALITVKGWELDGRDRVLSPDEFRAIRSHAVEWMQVAMDLGYLTGARPSDIRALRWDDVGERVGMRQKKTAQRMRFTINDDLASVLERARQRPILGLYVVATERGRPTTRNTFGEAWRAAVAAAKVDDAQFRDIRAMAAAAAEDGGQDFQALLGHTTRRMAERYLKGRREIKAEPVRRKL